MFAEIPSLEEAVLSKGDVLLYEAGGYDEADTETVTVRSGQRTAILLSHIQAHHTSNLLFRVDDVEDDRVIVVHIVDEDSRMGGLNPVLGGLGKIHII